MGKGPASATNAPTFHGVRIIANVGAVVHFVFNYRSLGRGRPMFRSPTSSPRSPVPPSSFPSGLHPSRDDRNRNRVESNAKRMSRVDMSFEQALQTDGTVVIKEGIDVDTLGQDLTPTPPANVLSSSPTNSPRPHNMAAPLSSAQLKSSPTSPASRPPASASTSASSSSNDLFYDAEDPEYQTRRRSMYRSQGTASSPDLATLVRKAKQRGSILSTGKDRRQEAAPPLPSGPHPPSDLSSRPRNASSASSPGYPVPIVSPPPMPKSRLQRSRPSAGPSSSSDWVLANSSHDDETAKVRVGQRLECEGFLTPA